MISLRVIIACNEMAVSVWFNAVVAVQAGVAAALVVSITAADFPQVLDLADRYHCVSSFSWTSVTWDWLAQLASVPLI